MFLKECKSLEDRSFFHALSLADNDFNMHMRIVVKKNLQPRNYIYMSKGQGVTYN